MDQEKLKKMKDEVNRIIPHLARICGVYYEDVLTAMEEVVNECKNKG